MKGLYILIVVIVTIILSYFVGCQYGKQNQVLIHKSKGDILNQKEQQIANTVATSELDASMEKEVETDIHKFTQKQKEAKE